MNSQGSDDATQPISQSVFEEVIRSRSEALLSNPEPREGLVVSLAANGEDTVGAVDTQYTISEGDTGFLDLISSLAAPQADSEPVPVDFSPTQSQLPLTQFPDSQRYKTPATAGRKRDRNGNVLDTPTHPRNPLARRDQATPGNLLGLSQAFAATQAASSPVQAVPTSALRSDRPSPRVEVQLSIENPPTPSPLRPLSEVKRAATEPATCYVPIDRSQNFRRDSGDSINGHGDQTSQANEEEESEFEPSIVAKIRREKQREVQVRQQLQSASSPVSPEKLCHGRISHSRHTRSASERPSTIRQKDFPSSPPSLGVNVEEKYRQEKLSRVENVSDAAVEGAGPGAVVDSSSGQQKHTHIQLNISSTTLVPNTTRRNVRLTTQSVRELEPSPSMHRIRREQEVQSAKANSHHLIRIANSQKSAPSSQVAVRDDIRPSSGHESVDVIPASQVAPEEPSHQGYSATPSTVVPVIHHDVHGKQNDRTVRAADDGQTTHLSVAGPNSIVLETRSAVGVPSNNPSSSDKEEQVRSTLMDASNKDLPVSSARSIESSQPIRTTPPGRKRKRMTEMSQDAALPSATQSSNFDVVDVLALDGSPGNARMLATAREDDAESDFVIRPTRRRGANGGAPVLQFELEDARIPSVSTTYANISRRISPRNGELGDNDGSLALSPTVPSPIQMPGETSEHLAHKTPTKGAVDSIWELGKSPKPRLVSPAFQSRTQPTSPTRRRKGTQRFHSLSSSTAIKTPKNLRMPLPLIEEASPDPLAVSTTSTTPSTPDTSSERIVASKMIFAYYMGRTRAYYPAVCLGLLEDNQQCKIKWPGYDAEVVPRHGVCSLDLRPGDDVKIDRDGFPRTAFTILGFEPLATNVNAGASITDIYGHVQVKVVPKQRKSLVNKRVTIKEEIVPISSLYIELSTWNRISKRPFVYTSALATNDSDLVSTPPNRPVTPGTPSSRSRHSVRSSSVLPQNRTGMFSGMAFALSFDDTTRDRVATLVLENGGSILSESFAELFDNDLHLKSDFSSVGFTAFLTNRHARTKKYMQALALGLPCLHGKWIEACVQDSGHINHWQDYLLPAGESVELAGAVRSRILPCSININHTLLKDILESRTQFFTQNTQIVFVTGRPKAEPRPHLFFVRAMADASCIVERAVDLVAAGECLSKLDRSRSAWLIVDNNKKDIDAAHTLVGDLTHRSAGLGGSKGATKQKRNTNGVHSVSPTANEWGLRVADDEFVMQSLILGRLCSK